MLLTRENGRDALVEAMCTDLKLVQAARQAEQARVQQRMEMIDTEVEAKLAASRREGVEECERKIAAIKEAGKLENVRVAAFNRS